MANCRWLCLLWLVVSGPLSADDKQTQIESAVQAGRYVEAETLLRQQINIKPTNWDAHFRLAKVLSWQKKFAEAEFEYQMLLAREPGNADYLLGLAQVCVWRGDARAALPLIETAKSLAPGDPDVWRLHIQALAAVNDTASRRQALLVQQQAAERFPELNWVIVSSASPEPQVKPASEPANVNALDRKFDIDHYNQIELGASYDHLSKNKGFWRAEYLSFEHRFAPRQLVYATFLQTERFRFNDGQFLLGGYYPLSPKLTLNLEGNVSPSPQVLASNSIMASLQGGLGQGWFLTGGFRHSEYGTGPLQQGFATLESYFADFRAAYTVKVTDSFDKTQFGHRFDFSYYYQDTSFITLTYNIGAETGGFQGVVYDTQFFGLHGRHWFKQGWALTWELGHIKQGDAYSREGVGLGIRRAF
jgi:YaiO family outer membrane protein